MRRSLIKDVNREGEVEIAGWVNNIRNLGKVTFIELRDRTGYLQVVIDATFPNVSRESSLRILGKAVKDERSPTGYEVHAEHIDVLNHSSTEYHLKVNSEPTEHLDIRLDNRALDLRRQKNRDIFKIQANLMDSFRESLRLEDFVEIATPKIVSSGTEGGSALFSIDYFGRPVYLAQSPQLYKQMMVGVFERVFEISHVFRAEKHDTTRHLNEYVSMDLEMGFIRDEHDVMDLEEGILHRMIDDINQRCSGEARRLGMTIPNVVKIPRLPFNEVKAIVGNESGKEIGDAGDLDPESERLISEYVHRNFNSEFLFITNFPLKKRPFYTMPSSKDENIGRSFDLLFRGLEVTTGGQRIHRYDELVSSLESRGHDANLYKGYLLPFKYGLPPHGGLAIGLERLTAKLVGLSNVQEASLFPRTRRRTTP